MHSRMLFATVTLGTLLSVLTACTPKVATVEISPKEISIKGETDAKVVTATAKDKDGKNIELNDRKPTWSSADPAVVVIDQEGKVKPTGSGKTMINAKIDEASGNATVTVQLLKGIKLESPAVVVKAGVPHPPLKVAFNNEKGEMIDVKDAKVDWKTADPNIATIGPDGTITGVNAGSTTITARADTLTADVAVTVTPADMVADAGPAGAETPPAPGTPPGTPGMPAPAPKKGAAPAPAPPAPPAPHKGK